jgi:glycosyltransferase involved in cell wall biosynthesis
MTGNQINTTRRDFVIVGLQAWYTDIGSNCKSIAMELARNHRVLYINMPLDRKTIIHQKDDPNISKHIRIIQNKEENLFEVMPNLWNYYPRRILESINWIPSTPVFSVLNRINNRRFAKDIREATQKMGFKDYIIFNDNDIFRSIYLKDLLDPQLYIYYSRDNLLGVDYWKKHGNTLEPRHIAKADIGVANSTYLANYLRRYNSNSYYIGQGCNLALFDATKTWPVPDDMQSILHPVIGYVGAINSLRIDPEVIRQIARSDRNRHIVLVGPEDDFFKSSDLHSLSNIHWLGKKPIDQLAGYIAAFDVCINPQLINDITIGNYPLKVDEYLAMGKPVVATRTDAMQVFQDHVYMADKPEDYPGLIEKALQEDNNDLHTKRIALAQTHSWENSVQEMIDAINKTVSH